MPRSRNVSNRSIRRRMPDLSRLVWWMNRTLVISFILILGLGVPVLAQENLIANPGFEQVTEDGLPVGWRIFAGSFGSGMEIESGNAYSGERVLRFTEMSQPAVVGIYSEPVPAVPGVVYNATAKVKSDTPGTRVSLYIDFLDENERRVDAQYVLSSGSTNWEDLSLTMQAPEGTAYVSVILYRTTRHIGVQRWDDVSLVAVKPVAESAGAVAAEASDENLLLNPGFESVNVANQPIGWQVFAGQLGTDMVIDTEKAYAGERSLLFTRVDAGRAAGLRSTPIPAVPGAMYTASVQAMSETVGAPVSLYLDFWDASRSRILARSIQTRTTGTWEHLEVTLQAPENAVWVSIILYRTPSNVGVQRFDNASLVMWELESEEPFVDELTLDYTPADGTQVTTNPPSFIWVPVKSPGVTYTLEYSSDPDFSPGATTQVPGIDISVYTPPHLLDPEKTWYWRVHAFNNQGERMLSSETRAFTVAADATPFPLPPMEELRARVPREHPRLFVTPDTLPAWRQRAQSDPVVRIIWRDLYVKALTASFAPLPSEPPSTRPGGVWDVNLYRQSNSIANRVASDLELLAMAYLISGDEEIGEAARRLMVHVASWDPRGATSAADNDDASRPILISLSRAYTWANDVLSPEDRRIVLNSLRIRATEAYRILADRPFESMPYNSHDGGTIPWMGEVAIALLEDLPEATEWFDYVVRVFVAVYPPWGGDPGGWAEGPRYWGSSMNKAFDYADALKAATGLDLYQKPFFRNTGTHRLMTQPPYSNMGPFGDFADEGPTTPTAQAMWHLGTVYGDPHYKWYADQRGVSIVMGVQGLIRANLYDQFAVRPEPPVDYPTGAYYSDVGWVVFHNRLVAPVEERLQFMFKSSRYGSYSHSMADQNSFTLEAFDTPLAISSGYRPWYGSVHHMGWTKTTQAHNSVLVNGQGQTVQSLAAKGEILAFLNGETLSYTAGEAQQAYGPNVEQFTRHVVYVRPDLYVIFDDLKAEEPSTYSWLFHAYHPVEIDPASERLFLDAGKATLDMRLWSSAPLGYSQTDQFAVPLDEPMNKPVQWHLTATTQNRAQDAFFLAVLAPAPRGRSREVHAELLDAGAGEGVLIREGEKRALVIFRRFEGELSAGGLTTDGRAAAWLQDPTGREGLVMAGGTRWQNGEGVQLTASVALDAELTFSSAGAEGSFIYPAVPGAEPFVVTLTTPGRTVRSVVSSGEVLNWEAVGSRLTLHLKPGEHRITVTFAE